MWNLIYEAIIAVAGILNAFGLWHLGRQQKLNDEYLGKALKEIDQLKQENRDLFEMHFKFKAMIDYLIEQYTGK